MIFKLSIESSQLPPQPVDPLKLWPFALLLLTACGGCVLGASRETTLEPAPTTTNAQSDTPTAKSAATTKDANLKASEESIPDVQGELVKSLEGLVGEKGVKEGFGLFSEGGFSGVGSGQYMILMNENNKLSAWYAPTPNLPKGATQFKDLSARTAKEFSEQVVRFDGLAPFKAVAFDAFSYTYIHFKKTDGKTSRVKTLSIQNLMSDRPEAKPYNDVLSTFKSTMPQ